MNRDPDAMHGPEAIPSPSTLPEVGLVFLQDAVPERLAQAAAENHQHWFRRMALAAGGEAREENGALLIYTPGAEGEVTIAFPRLDAATTSRQLDAIAAYCRQRRPLRSVGCWSLEPPEPRDLGARLLARGFEWGWRPHFMWLDLARARVDHPWPDGLVVEPVEEEVLWEVGELPYHGAESAARLFAATRARPYRVWHFVARLEGRVVGQSVLNLTDGPLGVAGIYSVGVIPAARGRGIGTAVSLAPCLLAREIGCRHALLNSTQLGEPVYRKLGFETIGYGQTWWWHRERIDGPPPSPLQVALVEALGSGDPQRLDALAPELSPRMLEATLPCGLTPLEVAVQTGQPASAEWLVAHGATLDVLSAWDLGWKERVLELLATRPELANLRRGPWQVTPLHVAAERGDVELARLLLAARPDLEVKDIAFGSTPLGWARHFQHTQIVALIEEAMK